jgi:hypothetical protein
MAGLNRGKGDVRACVMYDPGRRRKRIAQGAIRFAVRLAPIILVMMISSGVIAFAVIAFAVIAGAAGVDMRGMRRPGVMMVGQAQNALEQQPQTGQQRERQPSLPSRPCLCSAPCHMNTV